MIKNMKFQNEGMVRHRTFEKNLYGKGVLLLFAIKGVY